MLHLTTALRVVPGWGQGGVWVGSGGEGVSPIISYLEIVDILLIL